jgi:hypothetical protein
VQQFNRSAQLIVGIGDKALLVGDLRMRFEVVKHKFSNSLPNSMVIKVYNLSSGSREKLDTFGGRVRLAVGYGGSLRVLFNGELRRSIHEHEDTEWVSTLYCADKFLTISESWAELGFAAGTSTEVVLKALAGSFGVDLKPEDIVGIDVFPSILSPLQITGSVRDAMDELSTQLGFSWGFQDGRLEIVGTDSHFADKAVSISAANGMIGSPVLTDMGVEVSTLLNPAIRVHRQIVIESVGAGVRVGNIEVRETVPTLHAGVYTVGEVISTGDTWGNEWISKIKTYRTARPL